MNCWKTINITKQYGSLRLFILSSVTVLFAFILLYLPVTYMFVSNKLYDNYFLLFLISLCLLYPIHKLLHYLPVAHLGKKIKVTSCLQFYCFPVINVRVKEPISKRLFLTALLLPFLVVTTFLVLTSFVFIHYVHYLTILLAVHCGMCVTDFLYAYTVIKAPRSSYIEENEDGYEILVFKSVS